MIKYFYPSHSLFIALSLTLSLSLSLYRSLSIAPSHSSLRSWLLMNFKTFLFFYYFLGNQTEFFTRFFFFFTIFVLISSPDHRHQTDFAKLVLLHSDIHTFPYPNPLIRYFFLFLSIS